MRWVPFDNNCLWDAMVMFNGNTLDLIDSVAVSRLSVCLLNFPRDWVNKKQCMLKSGNIGSHGILIEFSVVI
jgi:hypothetical protein